MDIMPAMILNSFLILLPLFTVTASGFILDRIFALSEETLVRITIDFFFPLLIFASLYESSLEAQETVKILGSTTFVAAGMLVAGYSYSALIRRDPKEIVPPLVFMNSGFLGIPLLKIWGGTAGMNYIVILDQFQTFFIFTLGIIIVSGGFTIKGLKEMAKSPLLWAIVLGFAFKYLRISLPKSILEILSFGGSAASPLAIFTLGVSLSRRRVEVDLPILGGVLLRIAGGLLLGFAAVEIFNIAGLLRTVVIVAASLPSAVFSFVLPARYGVKPQYAGSLVIISTAVSVFTVPLIFNL